MSYLLVFLGAGLGGVMRQGVNVASTRLGSGFPYGTFCINVLGSLAMGLVIGWFALRGDGMQARLFVTTGVLGGFTTFSAFSLDAVTLLERGETNAALIYVLGSVIVSIGALFVGLSAMRTIL
ncbi:MAG: fluoride efflux transporter CrcB [Methylobacterium sp.]|uniref:fluoride efflux transporter CrcB n=1 Tax=Methylobacterium sp. TaxID=409 RepID=UPI0025D9EA7D|nr:fluoride efflux transporter CrcB [Methylobacterium sp.]MBX9932748.1 fluoride efflux transporter CrcB [Methylobacterium sp.]